MDKTAYKLATSRIGVEDGEIRLGNELIPLEAGRNMVQNFLGERPRYPIDVALGLKKVGTYFKQLLDDEEKEKSYIV
jgi:hypothetical protein